MLCHFSSFPMVSDVYELLMVICYLGSYRKLAIDIGCSGEEVEQNDKCNEKSRNYIFLRMELVEIKES